MPIKNNTLHFKLSDVLLNKIYYIDEISLVNSINTKAIILNKILESMEVVVNGINISYSNNIRINLSNNLLCITHKTDATIIMKLSNIKENNIILNFSGLFDY